MSDLIAAMYAHQLAASVARARGLPVPPAPVFPLPPPSCPWCNSGSATSRCICESVCAAVECSAPEVIAAGGRTSERTFGGQTPLQPVPRFKW